MLHLYVKNEVQDFDTWLAAFQAEMQNNASAGLHTEHIWRDPENANVVYFLARVDDRAQADAYMASPEAAQVGERAGVTGGEIQYLETV